MSILPLLSILLLASSLTLLVLLFVRIRRDAPDQEELQRLRMTAQQLETAEAELSAQKGRIEHLLSEKAGLEARLELEGKASSEKLELLAQSETRLKLEFENLANRIFEQRGNALQEQGQQRMGALLEPFRKQLDDFRHRVEQVNKDSSERTTTLIEQVRQLQLTSNRVSEEANQLASAIKGDSKKQGDWGELIVERILEASGLEKGREYEAQTSIRTEDGTLLRPDFLVKLPDGKLVVLDSKVSLTAFERYASAEDPASRDAALKAHLASVRKHVRELQDKDYSQLMGNRSLDFVVMCVPLEPAYQLALQEDRELIYDLATSSVVITGPANLLITLKLIAQLWRREKENRNAEEIADEAGKLYDKIIGVFETVDQARSQLQTVTRTMDKAGSQLKEGRGNVVGRIEKLRKLGAKVGKALPAGLAEVEGDEESKDA